MDCCQDRGAVALDLDDTQTTIEVLNEAEALMEQRRKRALLEDVAALTINDQLTTYLGEPYEDIYVNVLKMLAQLERALGRPVQVEQRPIQQGRQTISDEEFHP